ncbi:hypothetical protein Tco_0979372 [Tanacetum coccineum]
MGQMLFPSSVPDTELVLYPLQDKLTSGDKSLDLSAFKLSRLFFSLLSSGSSSSIPEDVVRRVLKIQRRKEQKQKSKTDKKTEKAKIKSKSDEISQRSQPITRTQQRKTDTERNKESQSLPLKSKDLSDKLHSSRALL